MVHHLIGQLFYLVYPRAQVWGRFCFFYLSTTCPLLYYRMLSYLRMTVCFTAVLSLGLIIIRFCGSPYCGLSNKQLCVQMNFAPSSNTPLEGATFKIYLGVYITSSLNWSKQTVEVKKRANKILGVLQRNLASCSRTVKERAYLTLVRPVGEYGSAPLLGLHIHRRTSVNCVDSVQCRAARFVFNDYHRTSSVTNMISKTGWQDLETRRKISDLIMFFKIQIGNVKRPFPNDLL